MRIIASARRVERVIISSMMRIYQTYAHRVCEFFEMPAGSYTAKELNSAVMQLPFAEAHMELDGTKIDELPKIGSNKTLQEHAQASFFEVIGNPNQPLFLNTRPILVKGSDLEAIEHWREWKTLGAYLRQHDLEPCFVFRNHPHILPVTYTEKASWYLADLRMVFVGDEAFTWAGQGNG